MPLEQDCELPKRKYFTAERCVSLGAVQMQYPEEEDSAGGYQAGNLGSVPLFCLCSFVIWGDSLLVAGLVLKVLG